jgi:signal transduction histidine kinase
VLLAVLPAGLVTVIGVALAGLATYHGVGGTGGFDAPSRLALLVGALLTCAVLVGAGFLAAAEGRAITDRATDLSHVAANAQVELARAQDQLTQRQVQPERIVDAVQPAQSGAVPQRTAEMAVWKTDTEFAAPTRDKDVSGHEAQIEVFVNLARRLQSLVHREIGLLDELENNVEDPDLLKGIFQVDHLATRVRRYAENLAVLGGAVAERQWTRPVSLSDVLRSAVAEVEQYSRVKLVPPVPGTLRGHAVADVVHLLAELAENATVFSPPQTRVLLRVELVTAGLAIEVEDRGLGMTAIERNQMNALLTSPDRVILGELLRDGRIGLYVVSVLARRHGITVQLERNIYGGTQAVLVLPNEVLGQNPEAAKPKAPQPLPQRLSPAAGPPGRVNDSSARSVPTQEIALIWGRPAPVAQPRPAPTADPTPEGPRPSLPTRRRQEHLSPELRQPSHSSAPLEEVEHNPGLMAAFQAGIRRAENFEESDTSPGPGGNDPRGLTH